MATTETTKLQAELAHALAALEAGDTHAAERAVRAALQETGAAQMLTPEQAARWLGVDSHYSVLGFIKTGLLPSEREDGQVRVSFAHLQEIDDDPRVQQIRTLDALHWEIGDFGVPDELSQEQLDFLSSMRPPIYPKHEQPSPDGAP